MGLSMGPGGMQGLPALKEGKRQENRSEELRQ